MTQQYRCRGRSCASLRDCAAADGPAFRRPPQPGIRIKPDTTGKRARLAHFST